MKHLESQLAEADNWTYCSENVKTKQHLVDIKANVKNSQFATPLFEFSGACSGCGETPYVKLITQLYGDREMVANATGCSSIYSGSVPSTPYTMNENGHGPAWANSLFEDFCEFGLGMELANEKMRARIVKVMNEAIAADCTPADVKELFAEWINNMLDADKTKELAAKIIPVVEANKDKCNHCKQIAELQQYLVKRSQWIIGGDGKYAGCIIIEDEIKADAPAAIKLLKSAGIRKTVMLTGDADAVGKKVAGQLHLDQVYTELLPADKVDRVESLLKQKSEKGMLAFVGDGINDAPVLARADVGIAMGGLGSDAAIEAADVVLMTDEPSKIAAVMKIARKTIRIANQNIVFALGVKFLVLILGALGYANMWAAVFADVGVSIIAILNAIRAMRVKLPDMPAGSTNQG